MTNDIQRVKEIMSEVQFMWSAPTQVSELITFAYVFTGICKNNYILLYSNLCLFKQLLALLEETECIFDYYVN